MNIASTTKAPANSFTLTINVPKVSGQDANAAVWDGVDRLESTGQALKGAASNFAGDSVELAASSGRSFTQQVGRTLKFGAAGAVPLFGLQFGKQVKGAIGEGKVNNSGATNWANAAMGVGQVAGLGMAALAVGSVFTGIGNPSTLLVASAVGFGASAAGAAVLANTTDASELAVEFKSNQ